jgi:tRNA-dihydrouridine synthase A
MFSKAEISGEKGGSSIYRRISVAPMMDWTDRHCRFFLRQLSPSVLLYTEMINATAILRGSRERLLAFSPEEHPLALQLGGSDPSSLAAAAKIAEDLGYVEINLNCGCPSDRVHAGSFGACLMLQPQRVAECVAAMKREVRIPVTVKYRIGVVEKASHASGDAMREAMMRFDDSDHAALVEFTDQLLAAGTDVLIVHARKAVLGGLSPHENRTVPPLRFDVVTELKKRVASRAPVVVNGGVRSSEAALSALHVFDGVMIGREAYHRPQLLRELHAALAPESALLPLGAVLANMHDYLQREQAQGTRPHAVTRHMLGLLTGHPGARELRRLFSEEVLRTVALPEVFQRARELARGVA